MVFIDLSYPLFLGFRKGKCLLSSLNDFQWLQTYLSCETNVLPRVQQQTTECIGFTTQQSQHSSSQLGWWWIAMWWTQISISQRFVLDWHDPASHTTRMPIPGGIILLGIHLELRKQPYVVSVPSTTSCELFLCPLPSSFLPAKQLCRCGHLVTVYFTLLTICFSLSASSWVRVCKWSMCISSPMCSLRFSVTAPVK